MSIYHRNPNNPHHTAVVEVITSLHDLLYELITSPVGAVLSKRGLEMEVLPGPVYRITFPDKKTIEFQRE
jgi:hypothetical protein